MQVVEVDRAVHGLHICAEELRKEDGFSYPHEDKPSFGGAPEGNASCSLSVLSLQSVHLTIRSI